MPIGADIEMMVGRDQRLEVTKATHPFGTSEDLRAGVASESVQAIVTLRADYPYDGV